MAGDRIVNDHSFQCTKLMGSVIDRIVSFYEGNESNGVDMLLIKVKESDLWQRFFLDAGIGFWEEYDTESAFEDYEGLLQKNIMEIYNLKNRTISIIECSGGPDTLSSFHFDISGVKLVYHYKNSQNMESDTILELL